MAETDPAWYAKTIQLTTGLVLGDLPLVQTPGGLQQINAAGNWTATTPIGGGGGMARDTLRPLMKGGRFGTALCWGTGSAADYIFQMGPILATSLLSESPPWFQIGGSDPWALLDATNLIDPATKATLTITSSMQGIAVGILNAALARNPLPIDVPAAIPGTTTMTYNWFDFITAGQRLQELTQAAGGPDIYFRPYFADAKHVRWQAVIGNPYIVQSGNPLLFDQGSNLVETLPETDASRLAGTVYDTGNGTGVTTTYATATDPSLEGAGWPLWELNNSAHADVSDPVALQAFASGDLALNNRPVETWPVTVRTDGNHPLGTYGPGPFAWFSFSTHPLQPPGRYFQRILGLTREQNTSPELIDLVLHATQGAI